MADSLMQLLRGGIPAEVAAAPGVPPEAIQTLPNGMQDYPVDASYVYRTAPEWVPPPELTPEQTAQRAGGGAAPEELTEQQRALLGHFGEARREEAGRSLYNYIAGRAGEFGEGPSTETSWPYRPPMTGDAQSFMAQQHFAVDPNRIGYTGEGGFVLDAIQGPQGMDPFFGQLPKELNMNQIPRALQILLGPSMAQYYGNRLLPEKGGAPPWSRFFAPPGNQLSSSLDKTWPGITMYDAWRRPLGEYANLYS